MSNPLSDTPRLTGGWSFFSPPVSYCLRPWRRNVRPQQVCPRHCRYSTPYSYRLLRVSLESRQTGSSLFTFPIDRVYLPGYLVLVMAITNHALPSRPQHLRLCAIASPAFSVALCAVSSADAHPTLFLRSFWCFSSGPCSLS